jgi:hypothetical protein
MLDLSRISSSILQEGDETTAYRDPAVVYHEGVFHLFYTIVLTDSSGAVFLHLAKSRSSDLISWTSPRILTPADPSLNYSSPGSIVRFQDRWVLCLQTYPRPGGEKYADDTARLWTMSSEDLEHWDEPRLLQIKGPDVPCEEMGRMIDPYIFQDKDDATKWWCFYKQNGVSMSWSRDLETWHFFGHTEAGENACVVVEGAEYVLFHSPENGLGVKRSRDLVQWEDHGTFFLGQAQWPWAQGRITAGFVLDLRHDPQVGKCLLFFHGTGPEDEQTIFDTHACIGLAWSDTLADWHWIS